MQVITLGTGCPLPDPDRAGPATLVRTFRVEALVAEARRLRHLLGRHAI